MDIIFVLDFSLSIMGSLLISVHLPVAECVMPNLRERRICPLGQYIRWTNENTTVCAPCRSCPKGSEVSEHCTEYNNTVCTKCPPGTYNSRTRDGVCKKCTSCQPGQFLKWRCRPHRGTKCQQCYEHSYTDRENVSACRYCRFCRENESVVQNCTLSSDTVCGDCVKGYFREFGSNKCLPCSVCPMKISHRVVTKCRMDLGYHNPNICWPNYSEDDSDLYRLTATRTLAIQPVSTSASAEKSSKGTIPMSKILFYIAILVVATMALMLLVAMLTRVVVRCRKKSSSSNNNNNRGVSVEVNEARHTQGDGDSLLEEGTSDVVKSSWQSSETCAGRYCGRRVCGRVCGPRDMGLMTSEDMDDLDMDECAIFISDDPTFRAILRSGSTKSDNWPHRNKRLDEAGLKLKPNMYSSLTSVLTLDLILKQTKLGRSGSSYCETISRYGESDNRSFSFDS